MLAYVYVKPQCLLVRLLSGSQIIGCRHPYIVVKFSVPGFVQNLNFCQFGRVLGHFGHFKCACTETAIRLLPA